MPRLIRQGLTGADVAAVQDVLNFHVRRLEPLNVDGHFGPKTHARVMEFQRSNQLSVDGVVGPNTAAKLFEEEELPVKLVLSPRPPSANLTRFGLQTPRLIPPLVLPPIIPPLVPFFLPPDSTLLFPPLTLTGQTLSMNFSSPVRTDPVDPAVASHTMIVNLLDNLPSNFPFRATIIGAVPKPVKKVGPLNLDPVSPMTFGFQWGVKPVFDLKKLGPPPEFAVGAAGNARYVLKVIDKPGALVPQLGIFGQGDFRGTIDWTSNTATSRPQFDFKGSVFMGVEGRF